MKANPLQNNKSAFLKLESWSIKTHWLTLHLTRLWPILVLTLVTLWLRILTLPWFIESRDGLFFTRGVERYSVFEMRPQWPGYPVYIWLGKFFNLFFNNSTQALHVLSALTATLTILPIAALVYNWQKASGVEESPARLAAVGGGLIWALVPLSWLGGSEIFSDSLALLMAVTMLWFCGQALSVATKPERWLIPAAIIGGLMLGARLSYVALLLPIFFVAWQKRRHWKYYLLPFLTLLSLGLSVGVWLGWQWWMEGSRFFEAATRHLEGHYSSWGGSVTTDHNLLTRPLRLLDTLITYGFGGWWPDTPLIRLPLTLVLAGLMFNGGRRLLRSANKSALILALAWISPYFAWIMLGNDVDLARYDLPFVAMGCILAAMGIPTRLKIAYPTVALIVLTVGIVSVPLALEHQNSLPIAQRLPAYMNLELKPEQSTLIIGDDTSPLIFFAQEYAPSIQSIRVLDADLPVQVQKLSEAGRSVYITSNSAVPPKDWLPVARLCRSRFMESRGSLETWFYRYSPGTNIKPTLACFQP